MTVYLLGSSGQKVLSSRDKYHARKGREIYTDFVRNYEGRLLAIWKDNLELDLKIISGGGRMRPPLE
jgi:hypothetical protein